MTASKPDHIQQVIHIQLNIGCEVLEYSLLHYGLQISDEPPQIDFDVVENTHLLWAVLPPPLLTNLAEKQTASSNGIMREIKSK